MESIALQNVQLLRLMEKASNQKIQKIHVDGGASSNDFLMQFQADVLQTTLVRAKNTETTSLGAAKAAFEGIFGREQTKGDLLEKEEHSIFTPNMSYQKAKAKFQQWIKAVESVHHFYSSMM